MEVKCAGGTAACQHMRETLSIDSWTRETILGCKLDFATERLLPPKIFTQRGFTGPREQIVDSMVEDMLRDEAISAIARDEVTVSSPLFLVPKQDGTFRPIIDLRYVNGFVQRTHFKMEGWHTLRELCRPDDCLVKIDLKSAYFSIPVRKQDRGFLCFAWKGRFYQWNCLPFGYAASPLVFTKVLLQGISALRQTGIRMVVYLDDILILHENDVTVREHLERVIHTLVALGFRINVTKCAFEPSRSIEYLGFTLDTHLMTVRVTGKRRLELAHRAQRAWETGSLTLHELEVLCGKLAATRPGFRLAPLYYRALQRQLASARRENNRVVRLNQGSLDELAFWKNPSGDWQALHLTVPPLIASISTDASGQGWGVASAQELLSFTWREGERGLHINTKELRAAFLGLRTYVSRFPATSQWRRVLISVDNRAAVAAINRLGSCRSEALASEAKALWLWADANRIVPVAQYIPGSQNELADFASRNVARDSGSWSLPLESFNAVVHCLGSPQIDLFADWSNAKCHQYFSWRPDPGCCGIDAFSMAWGVNGYAFPPFGLVGRVLQKVQQERVPHLLLIAPLWPARQWYPLLLESLCAEPLLLPPSRSLLRNAAGEVHPLSANGTLSLLACRVSGIPQMTRDFRKKLGGVSSIRGGQRHEGLTQASGYSGAIGVTGGVAIPCRLLQ